MVIWNSKSLSKSIITAYVVIVTLFVITTVIVLSSQKIAKKYRTQKLTQATLQQDLERLDDISIDISQSRSDLGKIILTLPDGYDQSAKMLSQIETRAKESKITIVDTELDTTADIGSAHTQILKITQKVSGTYQDLTNYIHSISLLPYHSNIGVLDISKAKENSTTTIIINVYQSAQ